MIGLFLGATLFAVYPVLDAIGERKPPKALAVVALWIACALIARAGGRR
jgi:biopolymer transport protein ExbB/TolQ